MVGRFQTSTPSATTPRTLHRGRQLINASLAFQRLPRPPMFALASLWDPSRLSRLHQPHLVT